MKKLNLICLLAVIPALFFADKANIETTATPFEFWGYFGLAIAFTVITGLGLGPLVYSAKQRFFPKKA